MFWSLYTNDTFSTLSLNTNPSGAFISLIEYSPSGSCFDVAFPSTFVVIVSTTEPFLYNVFPSFDGSFISSLANISYWAFAIPFCSSI